MSFTLALGHFRINIISKEMAAVLLYCQVTSRIKWKLLSFYFAAASLSRIPRCPRRVSNSYLQTC